MAPLPSVNCVSPITIACRQLPLGMFMLHSDSLLSVIITAEDNTNLPLPPDFHLTIRAKHQR
jgi:hypothetical protein